MHLPFKKNRLSPEDLEIILLHRRHDPPWRFVIGLALVIGVLAGFEWYMTWKSPAAALAAGLALFAFGVPVVRWLFIWRTDQIAIPTDLIANATYVMGHDDSTANWSNVLDTPVRIAWVEVVEVVLILTPDKFRGDHVGLSIGERSGTWRAFRVPRITESEYSDLVKTLEKIAGIHRFRFTEQRGDRQWGMLTPPQ
jgi:hypothetical protein